MADHIQIGDITPRIQYAADGTQTVFVYPFPIFKDADMDVYLDDASQTTGYVVAGAGRSEGGTVTFDAPPAKGVLVTLRSRFVIERTSDFQPYGEFRAKVLNDELDYLTACVKQVNEEARRSLRLLPTDPADGQVMPGKADRASRIFGFDADGDPTVSTMTLAEIESLGDVASSAAATEIARTAAEAAAARAETAAVAATGGGILSRVTNSADARDILNVYAKSEVYNKSEIDRLFALAYAVITSTTTTGSQGVLFDDFSTDSLALKTNATYNDDGNYYENAKTKPQPPTSYYNPCSDGDRRSLINVTTNVSFHQATVENIIDGDPYTTYGLEPITIDSTRHITFDFKENHAKLITEAYLYFGNGTTDRTTWRWQGSNDGINYGNLGEAFSIYRGMPGQGGRPGYFYLGIQFNNKSFYRFYRLQGVSGSITKNTLPFLGEVRFAILDEEFKVKTYYTDDLTKERFAIADSVAAFTGDTPAQRLPINAFDDNDSTSWTTRKTASETRDAWIGQDFGSGNEKEITKVSLTQMDDIREILTLILIQYSDDGNNWYTAYRWNNLISAKGRQEVTFNSVGKHRFWRFRPDMVSPRHNWTVNEAEMFEEADVSNMTLRSEPQTLAQTTPKRAEFYFMVREIDTLDYPKDWDLTGGLQATGDPVFKTATFHSVQGFGQDKIVRYNVDLTGATGTKFVWELQTKNNKEQLIEQVAVMPFY